MYSLRVKLQIPVPSLHLRTAHAGWNGDGQGCICSCAFPKHALDLPSMPPCSQYSRVMSAHRRECHHTGGQHGCGSVRGRHPAGEAAGGRVQRGAAVPRLCICGGVRGGGGGSARAGHRGGGGATAAPVGAPGVGRGAAPQEVAPHHPQPVVQGAPPPHLPLPALHLPSCVPNRADAEA